MLKFLVFADLHYKKGMYAAGVHHLNAILDRAAREQVDFVIHMGDLCNDYLGSPELLDAYLRNRHGLAVYGIYGNHELESKGNTMEVVTPQLCNREVLFTESYWYTDVKNVRLIGLDTNYSYNEETAQWEHNHTASWGAPPDNKHADSLAPQQLNWLDQVLADATTHGKKALVFSHAAFSGLWSSSPDAPAVRALFAKHEGTVLMAVNGHLHTDHFAVVENVAYFDVNTVLNGCWRPGKAPHYNDSHTYAFADYDPTGKLIGISRQPLNALRQSNNTWFFQDPLCAVVTVDDNGGITIDGSETLWMHGIAPDAPVAEGTKPRITSVRWNCGK